MNTRARPLKERFLEKVQRSANGCWEWTANRHYVTGYGKIWYGGKTLLAHRVAYELFVGPIPDDLQLDHLCGNRGCVNPMHLEPVTTRTNLLRSAITKAAINLAKTHCPQGHPYNEENTYRKPDGKRCCRQCRLEADYLRRRSRTPSSTPLAGAQG